MSFESTFQTYPVSLPEHELLRAVRIKPGLGVLNLGTGADFRTLELAQRLGPESLTCGMLPEKDHVRACRESADRLQLPNIVLKQGILNQIPFTDQSFDLILLHCSIREMKYFYEVLAEVHRVARSDAQFLLCMLMKDALQEYFSIVENILNVLNMASELKALHTMKKSRMRSLQESEFVLKHLGFRISEIILGQYSLTFLDGRSFLNHQFAKKELIPDWKLFLNGSNKQDFFQQLESNLNKKTTAHGSLTLHMPFVVIDAGVGVTDLE